MLSASLLLAALATFSAGFLNGLTGFGLALTGVPLLLLVYEPGPVAALMAVLGTLGRRSTAVWCSYSWPRPSSA